jgi:hypothetical protein
MDLKIPRDAFSDVLVDGTAVWSGLPASTPAARRKTAAEDVMLRAVVAWESFVSEWFVGCVNHDAGRLRQRMLKTVNAWAAKELARSDFGTWPVALGSATSSLPRQPKLEVVRQLLDPGGRNIEFRDTASLAQRAHRDLAPRFATQARTLISSGAAELIDAALAIRNLLAHRSRQSVITLNQRVASFATYPALRKQSVSEAGVGTYLAAAVNPSREARLIIFLREFGRVARTLVP